MSNNHIYFSIIVVSLNTKKKLQKTLESIYAQEIYNKNYEIIVVDGLSNDGTLEEILKSNDKIDKLIIEKDSGIYDAMNKGIKHARGEWVIFLNSGDLFYENDILQKIYSLKLGESDVIYGNTLVNNNNLKYKVDGKNLNDNSINIPFCHQSSFVKGYLLKKYNFNLGYKICADFDFFIKIFKKNFVFIKIDLIISTVESGGLSDQKRFGVFFENLKIVFRNALLFKNSFKIIYFFLILLLSKFIKIMLPNIIIQQILRKKYKKNTFN